LHQSKYIKIFVHLKSIHYIFTTILFVILAGGVFITSERFVNVENDAKVYFIGIAVSMLLLVCSVTRKGLYKLKDALYSSGVSVGFIEIAALEQKYCIRVFILELVELSHHGRINAFSLCHLFWYEKVILHVS
jgi:hypothetical protein